MNNIIIIPTLNPDELLIKLTNELLKLKLNNIMIIDDGSSSKKIFNKLNKKIVVLHNNKNEGKGYSIKKAIKEADKYFNNINAFITCDDDYQHLPDDIIKINKYLLIDNQSLVLGTRSFKNLNVPKKSRMGNEFSSKFFKLITGKYCPDTQTGLRGIPYSLKNMAINSVGNRYDYEMNFLINAANNNINLCYIPITTVYIDNNKKTHFNPIKDSYLIYKSTIDYIIIALLSFIIDISIFTILINCLNFTIFKKVLICTYLARIISGLFNYYLNRKCFNSHNRLKSELTKYLILFISNMIVSSLIVSFLSAINLNITIIKVLTDLFLFIVNYSISRKYIFKR